MALTVYTIVWQHQSDIASRVLSKIGFFNAGIIQGMVFFEEIWYIMRKKCIFLTYAGFSEQKYEKLKFFHFCQFDLRRIVTADFQEF